MFNYRRAVSTVSNNEEYLIIMEQIQDVLIDNHMELNLKKHILQGIIDMCEIYMEDLEAS